MIEEQAIVRAIEGKYALIETQRQSSCGSCDVKGACGTSLIATLFPERTALLRVENTLDVTVNDRVVVGMDEGQLQKSSLLLYAVPLLLFLLGAVLGEHFFNTELISIAGGLFGLIAGLVIVRHRASLGADSIDNPISLVRKVIADNAVSYVDFP